jgi:hypothetical protein
MNWGDFLAELRTELNDAGATQKFSDALLFSYLRDGAVAISEWLPRDISRVELTASEGDAQQFALPSDFLEEYLVECPADNALSFRFTRPGVRRTSSSRPLFYWVNAGNLYLDADPGSNAVLISYYGVHGIPADAADTAFDLTVPLRDIELLKLYILGRVFQRERSRQSLLDRFKIGTSDRTDNPITPEVNDFLIQYHEKLQERVGGKTVFLQRERSRK